MLNWGKCELVLRSEPLTTQRGHPVVHAEVHIYIYSKKTQYVSAGVTFPKLWTNTTRAEKVLRIFNHIIPFHSHTLGLNAVNQCPESTKCVYV